MRYTVGSQYLFVREIFEAKTPRFHGLYLPWEDGDVTHLVVEVKCEAHHKVPNYWQPNGPKDCDGFVFTLVKSNSKLLPVGLPWNNQFPSASYGQLDNDNDYRIRAEPPAEERAKFKEFSGFHYLEDLCILMGRVHSGMTSLELDDAKKAALASYFDKLKALASDWGRDVTVQPIWDDVPEIVAPHLSLRT